MMIQAQPWIFTTNETCAQFLDSIQQFTGSAGWCQGVTDEVLCWPATPANTTIRQLCPPMQGVDPTKYAVKTCDENGQWQGRPGQEDGKAGYTDYNGCFTEETEHLFEEFYGDTNNSAEIAERFAVVFRSRIIEMIGFPLSLVCITLSLCIFTYFRSLRCPRTKIHMHLLVAIMILTISKTIEIFDQQISGYLDNPNTSARSIRTTRHLCEMLVVLIEFSRTAMFMWMFLEGLYMHNMVAWKVFEETEPNKWLYCTIGWGFPGVLVSVWAPVVEFVWHYEKLIKKNLTDDDIDKCWYQHTESDFYNILRVPRLLFIAVNLLFLINIIRVLLTKLRDSHESDTMQIRKAIKAAIVLMPLLGVTHLIWTFPSPISYKDSYFVYASWMYSNHFLRSFEGVFVAVIYCFLNGEVQNAIKTTFQRRAIQRESRATPSLTSDKFSHYGQVDDNSIRSNTISRAVSHRFLKLLPCWNKRAVVRNNRKPSTIETQPNSMVPHCSCPLITENGSTVDQTLKEQDIEMR